MVHFGESFFVAHEDFGLHAADSGISSKFLQEIAKEVAAAPTLTCTAATQGVIGTAYSANCNAAGGTGTFTYSVSAGALPGGLVRGPQAA